jgi:hypothetical protein
MIALSSRLASSMTISSQLSFERLLAVRAARVAFNVAAPS